MTFGSGSIQVETDELNECAQYAREVGYLDEPQRKFGVADAELEQYR